MRQKRAQKVSKENQGYVAPNEERREFLKKKKNGSGQRWQMLQRSR